jgi:hypothetical protein
LHQLIVDGNPRYKYNGLTEPTEQPWQVDGDPAQKAINRIDADRGVGLGALFLREILLAVPLGGVCRRKAR